MAFFQVKDLRNEVQQWKDQDLSQEQMLARMDEIIAKSGHSQKGNDKRITYEYIKDQIEKRGFTGAEMADDILKSLEGAKPKERMSASPLRQKLEAMREAEAKAELEAAKAAKAGENPAKGEQPAEAETQKETTPETPEQEKPVERAAPREEEPVRRERPQRTNLPDERERFFEELDKEIRSDPKYRPIKLEEVVREFKTDHPQAAPKQFTGPAAIQGTGDELVRENADQIRQAQQYMHTLGIKCGPVDGIEGPLTRGGLFEYITANFPGRDAATIKMEEVLQDMKLKVEGPQAEPAKTTPDDAAPTQYIPREAIYEFTALLSPEQTKLFEEAVYSQYHVAVRQPMTRSDGQVGEYRITSYDTYEKTPEQCAQDREAFLKFIKEEATPEQRAAFEAFQKKYGFPEPDRIRDLDEDGNPVVKHVLWGSIDAKPPEGPRRDAPTPGDRKVEPEIFRLKKAPGDQDSPQYQRYFPPEYGDDDYADMVARWNRQHPPEYTADRYDIKHVPDVNDDDYADMIARWNRQHPPEYTIGGSDIKSESDSTQNKGTTVYVKATDPAGRDGIFHGDGTRVGKEQFNAEANKVEPVQPAATMTNAVVTENADFSASTKSNALIPT